MLAAGGLGREEELCSYVHVHLTGSLLAGHRQRCAFKCMAPAFLLVAVCREANLGCLIYETRKALLAIIPVF